MPAPDDASILTRLTGAVAFRMLAAFRAPVLVCAARRPSPRHRNHPS